MNINNLLAGIFVFLGYVVASMHLLTLQDSSYSFFGSLSPDQMSMITGVWFAISSCLFTIPVFQRIGFPGVFSRAKLITLFLSFGVGSFLNYSLFAVLTFFLQITTGLPVSFL
jgi:hypothetical protein